MVRAEIWSCRDFSHQNFYDDKVLAPWPNSSSELAHILHTVATQCQQHVSAGHVAVQESQVYISCTYAKMEYPGHVDNICCIICGYWEQHTAVLLHCPIFIVLCQNLCQIPMYSCWILQWLVLTHHHIKGAVSCMWKAASEHLGYCKRESFCGSVMWKHSIFHIYIIMETAPIRKAPGLAPLAREEQELPSAPILNGLAWPNLKKRTHPNHFGRLLFQSLPTDPQPGGNIDEQVTQELNDIYIKKYKVKKFAYLYCCVWQLPCFDPELALGANASCMVTWFFYWFFPPTF